MTLLCATHIMTQLLPLSALLLAAFALPREAQYLLTPKDRQTASVNLGNGFTVSQDTAHLVVKQHGRDIWKTIPGSPLISASAGNDSVTGSNGAFKIDEIDVDRCQDQSISSVSSFPWDGAVNSAAAQIAGGVLQCGDDEADYTLTFWVPSDLPDRVAFYLDIGQPLNPLRPLTKLYLTFSSRSNEDFYGLGAQASFASLKNRNIPIFTREQGVGRGEEPITSIENADGSLSGGDRFTTYAAIPSYISTDGNVFYLSEKTTGYTNFETTDRNAVTVRHDSLSVDGAFT